MLQRDSASTIILFICVDITMAHEIMEQTEQETRDLLHILHMPNIDGRELQELTVHVIETSKPLKLIYLQYR
jgi:hypothetical protein